MREKDQCNTLSNKCSQLGCFLCFNYLVTKCQIFFLIYNTMLLKTTGNEKFQLVTSTYYFY